MRKVVAFLALAVAVSAVAQQQTVAKRLRVNLKIPRLLFTTGPGQGICVYCFTHTVDIDTTDSGLVRVAGRDDWETAAFPTIKAFTVERVERQGDLTVVNMIDMKTPVDDAYRTLRFKGPGWEKAFWQVVFPLSTPQGEIDAYSNAVVKRMAEAAFPSDTAIAPDRAVLIMNHSQNDEHATAVSRREFKGQKYLVVDLGVSPYVYNDLKMSDTQRLAGVFKNRLLSAIRGYIPLLAGSAFDGLALRIIVPHRAFGPGFSGSDADQVEFFGPIDAAKKFANADISAQDLLRASIVISNGNRYDLDLSQF